VTVTVRVDAQGRVVIPRANVNGWACPMGVPSSSSPEGVLLERRRQATVTSGEDGLPLVTLDDVGRVGNAEATEAIHTQRADR
jgi:hypothetical protein